MLVVTLVTVVGGASVPTAASSATPSRAAKVSAVACTPRSTPGQRWVQAVYRELLGRCAEEAAAKHGDAIVADPGKRGAYTRSIVRSIENGYRWVNHWTRTYCGRPARENEGRSYANKLAITAPNDNPDRWEYVHGLVLDEYCAYKHFGGTDEDYVRGIFQLIFGRAPSASDVTRWKNYSGLGMSLKLSGSSEGRRVQVRRSYLDVLGRAAKQADLDYWMPRLLANHGYDKLNLDAALAASNEFVRKAQST